MKAGKNAICFLAVLLLVSTIFVSGCADNGNSAGENKTVKSGDTVQADYTGNSGESRAVESETVQADYTGNSGESRAVESETVQADYTGNSGESRAVKSGDTVQINYIGKFENGTVFDTSIEKVAQEAGIYNPQREYTPLNITVGSGQVIEGFEEGLIGMKEGEEKNLTIPPEKAYGEYNESWVQSVPIEELNTSEKPEVGQTLYNSRNGVRYRVIAVNETYITLDPNPELAGKTLVFYIKLVSIEGSSNK